MKKRKTIPPAASASLSRKKGMPRRNTNDRAATPSATGSRVGTSMAKAATAIQRDKTLARRSPAAIVTVPQDPTSSCVSNVDLMALALHTLGGATKKVDTEDAAKRAHELAPGRLVWRKYPDQINLELVRVYLSDAKKPDHGRLVVGSGRTGWMLTPQGLARATYLASKTSLPSFTARRPDTAETLRKRTETLWLMTHPVLATLRDQGPAAVSVRELERLFKLDEYMIGAVRERRIARVLNAITDDAELLRLLKLAAARLLT